MKTSIINQDIKIYRLSYDEPILSSFSQGKFITFKKGDHVIVLLTKTPSPGSIILINKDSALRLCRYEKNNGKESLFPPIEFDKAKDKEILIGEVVDHIRIGKWLSFEGNL